MKMPAILNAVIAVSMWFPLSAWSQEQCSEQQQTDLDSCVASAIETCTASFPGCNSRQIRIDEVIEKVQERCMVRKNGLPRLGGFCRACINSLIVDLRTGPTRRLWPEFTAQVATELRELRSDCGKPGGGGSSSSSSRRGLCDRFPNLPRCRSSSSHSQSASPPSSGSQASASSASSQESESSESSS